MHTEKAAFVLISFWGLCFGAEGLNIISKTKWKGAVAHGYIKDLQPPVNNVIICHTVSQTCNTQSLCERTLHVIQKWHMDNLGFQDIGYNFLIGDDGNIYEGRGWTKVGAHTQDFNSVSIGIAFIGNFTEQLPSTNALNAAQNLIAIGVQNGYISRDYRLFGHRQLRPTISPGDALYEEIITWRQWSNDVPIVLHSRL